MKNDKLKAIKDEIEEKTTRAVELRGIIKELQKDNAKEKENK